MPDESTVNSQPVNQPPSETPASWDDALKGFSPDVQALYASHVSGLKNTVQATREERDALAKQIREVSAKAEKGSELEKSLTELGTRLEAAERKAAFVEDAVRPEIGCRNPKAAYALATSENLFDRKGNPDWAAIKAQAPELFGAAGVNGNAGAGTQSPPPKNSMNDFIRRSAGRS
jgi:hypothetical protein